jgi:hypothetical protein
MIPLRHVAQSKLKLNNSGAMDELASLSKCISVAGLRADELFLGVALCERHQRLFASYRFAELCSGSEMQSALVDDIRAAIAMFAFSHAADLLIVLRKLLGTGHRAEQRFTKAEALLQ